MLLGATEGVLEQYALLDNDARWMTNEKRRYITNVVELLFCYYFDNYRFSAVK